MRLLNSAHRMPTSAPEYVQDKTNTCALPYDHPTHVKHQQKARTQQTKYPIVEVTRATKEHPLQPAVTHCVDERMG